MQADDKNTVPSGLNSQLLPKTDEFYLERMKEILAVNSSARPPSEPVEMAENVFMGSQKHAEDLKLLRSYGITHVVNCAGSKLVNCAQNQDQRVSNTLYPEESGISECLILGAVDHEDYDIGTHFDKAIDFLNSVEKKGGRTLVHCNLGVNRSGAIMAAYLMVRKKMGLLSVIDYVKQKRSVVLSNRGFRKQLISFAKKKGLLETSAISKTSKEKVTNSTSDLYEGRSPQTLVRFQSYDQWINCEDLDSRVILPENDSNIFSLKNRVQAATKPKFSDSFWSFSRSFVKWRSKTHGRRNERNSESAATSPMFGQLDPVYEHSETGENAQTKSSERCNQQTPHLNNQQRDRPSSAQRSNSFLSLLKIPGRRVKSSSLSDFHSLHQSTSSASFIEEFDPSISSSATRPLRISQSVGKNITSC